MSNQRILELVAPLEVSLDAGLVSFSALTVVPFSH